MQIKDIVMVSLQECGSADKESLPRQPVSEHSGKQQHLGWPDSWQHPKHLWRCLCNPKKHDQYYR